MSSLRFDKSLSLEYKCLVLALLQISPGSRLPLSLIFTHPWVIKMQMKHKLDHTVSDSDISPMTPGGFESFDIVTNEKQRETLKQLGVEVFDSLANEKFKEKLQQQQKEEAECYLASVQNSGGDNFTLGAMGVS